MTFWGLSSLEAGMFPGVFFGASARDRAGFRLVAHALGARERHQSGEGPQVALAACGRAPYKRGPYQR